MRRLGEDPRRDRINRHRQILGRDEADLVELRDLIERDRPLALRSFLRDQDVAADEFYVLLAAAFSIIPQPYVSTISVLL